eukprot:m.71905 g.71905  ORF g.71905 m.71905 type:complete len:123 (-) comp7971_c0_seq1:105-473(-)
MYPGELLLATVCVGFCFGGMFALAPVLVNALFGTAYFGTNWGFLVLAAAIGSMSLGAVYGRIYDSHVPADSLDGHCLEGAKCFQSTFVVTSCLLVVGCVLILALSVRILRRHSASLASTASP